MGYSAVLDFLSRLHITGTTEIVHNPSFETLFEHETNAELEGFARGFVTETGAVNVFTGAYTGRSPKDKYIVEDDLTRETFWWAGDEGRNDNKPMSQDIFNTLKRGVGAALSGKKLYVIDGICGASAENNLKVRFVMEVAWQAHFVKNMFINPSDDELANFEPDFTVINGSRFENPDWQEQGLNSSTFIAFNLSEGLQLIGNTWYGGEMKKGIFSVMNYLLPQRGIASMHCSANQGIDGDVALFFGLSGTGKTTLSTAADRALIGDDEHGWDDDGVFNFEGGCYAKTIDLSAAKEPEIHAAIRRDALLENVVMRDDGSLDFSDSSITENTRVSYPLTHIDNIVRSVSRGGHAKRVIFLTADAFGVLPAVSLLNDAQAQYHFLSGFTSKLAGTERGITKPTPAFSACFGAAFLALHPTKYAETLTARIHASSARVYLVNTGWNGTGERISLAHTRTIISQILSGKIDVAAQSTLPVFGLSMPIALANVSSDILDPRGSYLSESDWQERAEELARLFIQNFTKFTDTDTGKALISGGPHLASAC